MSENTEIVKSERFISIVETAQSAILKNQSSLEKAKDAGQALLDTIEASGMSDELDKECNDFLVKVRITDTKMKERRNPVTQIFDQIRKSFTSLEGELKSIGETVKEQRDLYAKQKAEEQRKREAEAQRKLNQEKEKAAIAAEAETAISRMFNSMLNEAQSKLLGLFDNATLENFEVTKKRIEGAAPVMDVDRYNYFQPSGLSFPRFNSKEDVALIINQAKETKLQYYQRVFADVMDELRSELLDKLPSKKTELEAMAEAEKNNAIEAARLKAEREAREKAEKERLAKEAAEREEKEKAEAEARKQEAEMSSLFEATEETVQSSSKAEVRAGYDITITHPAGYVQIFQLWFEYEGKNLGVDIAGRRSLNQMKSFCEKHAHKTGEKITSPYVKYEESYSTVAKA